MKKITLTLVLSLNALFTPVWAANAFVIKKIDIQGLQRIAPEAVYSYLPVKRGETLRSDNTAAIIKALYKTGFFEHISLQRQGSTLVITVVERETIGELKISGNNVIPTDKLTSVMKGLDIAEGRVYNRAILERIKQGLLSQYYQLGRYNARIDVIVTPLTRNRVEVKIQISEGLVAKIRRINIIGNKNFSDKQIVSQFTISTPGLFTFFTQTDQYSQEKLEASLEGLRNFYLDRGYIKILVKSAQVSITPDRKSVYVTIVVDEGVPYTVKDYTLTGDFIVPREEIVKLIQIHPGQTFSRKAVVDSEKAITDLLGSKGYLYANVALTPKIDEKNKEISLALVVKPGKKTYVRHIYFSDNSKTNDEVLRREMQQLEAAPISTVQLEESKRRLSILPYMKDVQMSVDPVTGHEDQVDVNYKVTENNSAELTGRVGYSQLDGFLVGAGVNQKNFLGTGKTIGLNAERSAASRIYSANYTDPYFTSNGISRSTSISLTKFLPSRADLNNSYRTNEYDVSDVFSIPMGQETSAVNRLDLGYGYQNTLITLTNGTISNYIQNFINTHGRHFQQLDLIAGISRDTRDKVIFPTRGARQLLGVNLFLPVQGNSLRYYTVNYNSAMYHPLVNNFIFTARGAVAYGSSFNGGAQQYPFFKNFYAGGMDSVRGYAGNTLGPLDNTQQSTGGNLLVDASLGLILPNFISDNIRTSIYVDGGNVFQTFNNRKFGGIPSGPLRFSSGVQAEWLSPMGPINVSLAKAINPRRATASVPGDDLEIFQFSMGANFG
ncbi:MAG: outer membrane protein assembly factor BamA [Gammaproteobacteria bacterium]|nr:outer membrane protein assembly factor BamA [Gammaproteobacteria bacterium]